MDSSLTKCRATKLLNQGWHYGLIDDVDNSIAAANVSFLDSRAVYVQPILFFSAPLLTER